MNFIPVVPLYVPIDNTYYNGHIHGNHIMYVPPNSPMVINQVRMEIKPTVFEIATGNSARIIYDPLEEEYVKKDYIKKPEYHGEKHCQYIVYPYGFKKEVENYLMAKSQDVPFIGRMLQYDDHHCTITMTYFKDYITIEKYIEDVYETLDEGKKKKFFKTIFSLFKEMYKYHFIHFSSNMEQVLINPSNMDLKIINLKNSVFKEHSDNQYSKKCILNDMNDFLYTIFKKVYKHKIHLIDMYLKIDPEYYTSQRPVGNILNDAIFYLFSFKLKSLKNEYPELYKENKDFFDTFYQYRTFIEYPNIWTFF